MKANLIVITFILFLVIFAVEVASSAMLSSADNVNSQQLELHKSVLAQKQLETLAKYNQIEVSSEAIEASFLDIEPDAPVIEIAIKAGELKAEELVIKKGTIIHWTNEALLAHSLSLKNEMGEENVKFGNNTLRAGDKFYYQFDEVGDWSLVSSNPSGEADCTISVIE